RFPIVAVADEHGAFRIDGLAPGAVRVAARSPGLASWQRWIDVGEEPTRIAISLESGFTIFGEVTGVDGRPSSRSAAEIEWDGRIESSRALTGAAGEYRLEGIGAGSVVVHAVDETGISATQTVAGAPGDVLRWDPHLRPPESSAADACDGSVR